MAVNFASEKQTIESLKTEIMIKTRALKGQKNYRESEMRRVDTLISALNAEIETMTTVLKKLEGRSEKK